VGEIPKREKNVVYVRQLRQLIPLTCLYKSRCMLHFGLAAIIALTMGSSALLLIS
jgi:hypothetical protein